LIATMALVAAVHAPAASTDLLNGHDWAHFSGATVTSAGVRITPLDRWVTSQEGKRLQPDPPANLVGPHLEVTGDFQVDTVFGGVTGKAAYLQLYGRLPVIYDEWRQERPSVRVGVVGGRLEAAVWDGKSDKPVETKTFG